MNHVVNNQDFQVRLTVGNYSAKIMAGKGTLMETASIEG